jgi:hypothetical protein
MTWVEELKRHVICTAVASLVMFLAASWTTVPSANGAEGCAPGKRCLSVNPNGAAASGGADLSTAQCTGEFPDFISNVIPAGYAGPWFALSQDYPVWAPSDDAPWLKMDFTRPDGVDQYLDALRDYAFAGMMDTEFRPRENNVRRWFHMPLMNFATSRREPSRGLTEERPVTGPELRLKPGLTVRTFGIGFYNAVAAVTIGRVWKTGAMNLTEANFAEGAMTFKLLFSTAAPDDFSDSGLDPMAGAPQWNILTDEGVTPVRLLQLDVAVVDHRAPTGWIFGTLVYDKSAADASPWLRLRPVGLSWGNDPGFTPADRDAGKKLKETIISEQAPDYAVNHLGWAGRTNGPIDSPTSSCMSCHATAQFPPAADPSPGWRNPRSVCHDDDQKKLYWFRNLRGDQAFGAVDRQTCLPTTIGTRLVPLDFSLQLQVVAQAVLQLNNQNPCAASRTSDR